MKINYLLVVFMVLTFKLYAQKNITGDNINGVYKFEGKLGNRIPISMWFMMKDSVLKGELVYLNTAHRQPITILGTIENTGDITIDEFTKTGDITGEFKAMFKGNSLAGEWLNPVTKKMFNYILKRKDTTITAANKNLEPEEINGEYEYNFGENGGAGGIDIKHISGGNYLIGVNCVTPYPPANVAEVEKTVVSMSGNTIIYTDSDCSSKFRIRVFKDFVVINDIIYGNCFGVGAYVAGIFIKTQTKPSFD